MFTTATSRTSHLIDDILKPSERLEVLKPSERRDVHPAWVARPTPVYADSTASVCAEMYARRTPLEEYRRLMDPLRFAHLPFKGYSHCWPPMNSGYPLSMTVHHTGASGKRKGGQVRFSVEQTVALERRFGGHKYLSPEERRSLAGQLKLSDRQVKTWFQNRRAKWRRAHQSSSAGSVQSEAATSSTSTCHDDERLADSPPDSPISLTS